MAEIQSRIRSIYADCSLSAKEKSALVFKLLNPPKEKEELCVPVPKCDHYERKCVIYADCCDKWYGCRLCHDAVEDHKIDRYKIKRIKCKECGEEQDCSNKCTNCGIQFAKYYCDICHLWSNDEEIYHCDDCKICRKGKKENYFHCHTCGMDFLKEFKDEHVCNTFSRNANCPICHEETANCREKVIILPNCHHTLHLN